MIDKIEEEDIQQLRMIANTRLLRNRPASGRSIVRPTTSRITSYPDKLRKEKRMQLILGDCHEKMKDIPDGNYIIKKIYPKKSGTILFC